ncbi:MAG: hypothetical protein CM15mP58_17280 [Burkholderiaceae bacterium]|nr:MAG: hypothetical protein CM15mP58_17280 [Burkholderiaceae bacterium]
MEQIIIHIHLYLLRVEDDSTKMLDLAHEAGLCKQSVDVTEDYGLSTQVRLGQLETSENNREKSASITIYNHGRKGIC